jgi:hypothetical protein
MVRFSTMSVVGRVGQLPLPNIVCPNSCLNVSVRSRPITTAKKGKALEINEDL